MTGIVYISGEAHEIAKLVAEYGPKWGFEVPAGVDLMATVKPAPLDVSFDDDQDVGQLANDLEVEVKTLLEVARDSKVVGLLAALQRSAHVTAI